MDFNILDYSLINNGIIKCTKAIQTAIDRCNAAGGGKVIFPAGKYLCGSIRLRSNVELHLENGAELIASIDDDDVIDFSKDIDDDNEDTGWEGGCFIYACDEKNITISGTGTIDGQGRNVFFDDEPGDSPKECPLNVKGFRPRMTFLENVENLTIMDVTFRDSSYWTLHMAGCKNVRIENVSILNNKRGPNSDGIDPDCCKNVIIKGCNIICGDDCIVLKTTGPMFRKYGACENIVINGCILQTSCTAVKIGTETHGDIHDVIVSDCVIRDSIRGLGIWSRDGGEIYNIFAHHITGNTRNFADSVVRTDGIYSWWGEGEPIYISATKRAGVDRLPGKVHDIFIDHMVMDSEAPIIIAGEEYAPIENVDIKDIKIRFIDQSGRKEMALDLRPSEKGRVVGKQPVVFLKETKNVSVDGTLDIDESMKDYLAEI